MTHEAAYVASSPSRGPGSRLCPPAGGASQMTTHEEHVGLGRSPKGADGSAAVSTEGAGEGPESPRGPPKSKLGIGWLSGAAGSLADLSTPRRRQMLEVSAHARGMMHGRRAPLEALGTGVKHAGAP